MGSRHGVYNTSAYVDDQCRDGLRLPSSDTTSLFNADLHGAITIISCTGAIQVESLSK